MQEVLESHYQDRTCDKTDLTDLTDLTYKTDKIDQDAHGDRSRQAETGMSSEQLNDYLRGLGWSGAELSRRLGVTPKAVSEWRRGKRPVPGPVRAYVRLVVAVTVALREGKEGPP